VTSGAQATIDHGHGLALVTERLAAEFATRPEQVGSVVAEAYARTRDARVQSFRVLLAERDARAALHALGTPADAPRYRATA
jgi:hypothetical protein